MDWWMALTHIFECKNIGSPSRYPGLGQREWRCRLPTLSRNPAKDAPKVINSSGRTQKGNGRILKVTKCRGSATKNTFIWYIPVINPAPLKKKLKPYPFWEQTSLWLTPGRWWGGGSIVWLPSARKTRPAVLYRNKRWLGGGFGGCSGW